MNKWARVGKSITVVDDDVRMDFIGRPAEMIRLLLALLLDVNAQEAGQVQIDFGNTRVTGHVKKTLPTISLAEHHRFPGGVNATET
jgi:hypothetical protein